MSKILKLIAALIVIILLQRFCHKQTDGFALRKIQSTLKPRSEWNYPLPEENVRTILGQPFHYLGKGAQSYVFVSEDDQYVMKFFRHDRAESPLRFLPFSKKVMDKRRAKRVKDFFSYKLAFEEFREETGIIYLHLNKGEEIGPLTIYDKIGIRLVISLGDTEFLLQKKAELIYPTLEKWIENNEMDSSRRALSALIHLLVSRCKKGIFDKDPDLNSNFGLIGDRPIQIDPGRFVRDPSRKDPQVYQSEVIRITDNLKQWLDVHSPALSAYLLDEIHRQTNETENAI